MHNGHNKRGFAYYFFFQEIWANFGILVSPLIFEKVSRVKLVVHTHHVPTLA